MPENLYSTSAPVIIAAGALLKDNQGGKVLAQLKLRSIIHQTIKAVTVEISPLDTRGEPLGDAITHQYLDLFAHQDGEFGQKSPIPLPNPNTRGFRVNVKEVVFADNSLWSGCGNPWEPLPRPQPLTKFVSDPELLKQYHLKYGNRSYQYQQLQDLWYCHCGSLNRNEDSHCHACGASAATLKAISWEALRASKDERLAAEEDQRKADAEAKRAAAAEQAKKAKKWTAILLSTVAVLVVLVLLTINVILPRANYNDALALERQGDYFHAATAYYAAGDYSDARSKCLSLWGQIAQRDTISVGSCTVGLKADGTVVAVGRNDSGECNVSGWKDIVAISAGWDRTVGLKADGTVVAVGLDSWGLCNVSDWENIVAISGGILHTVGLKADGTVVAVGSNRDGQCNVSGWEDIVAISTGSYYTVGLKADGTVVAVGENDKGQCNVSGWKDIVAISTVGYHTVGLKADGTVVAVGKNDYGECNVSGWKDIVAISADYIHTVGLKADGTVVAVGDNDDGECNVSGWKDIVAISTDYSQTVGLKADGTVVAVGDNDDGECNVSGWKNIKLPEEK